MSEPIPDTHSVGDLGHTDDHNNIIQSLTDYETEIGALQQAIGETFTLAGGNVISVSATTETVTQIQIASGNRDTAADVIDVFCGGSKVFSLNGYGELRIFPALTSHVAQVIQALASQTGDLQQFQDSTGAVIFRVSSNGTVVAQQPLVLAQPGSSALVTETWHSLTMKNGFTADTTFNQPVPGYKMGPDGSVSFRGGIVTAPTGSPTGTTFATLPANYQPGTFYARWVVVANNGNTMGHAYIMPSGNLQLDGSFGNSYHVDITGRTYIDAQ